MVEVKHIVGAVVGTILVAVLVYFLVARDIPRKVYQRYKERRDGKRGVAALQRVEEQQLEDLEMARGEEGEVVRNSLQGGRLVVVVEGAGTGSGQGEGRDGGRACGLGINGLVGVPAGSTVVSGGGGGGGGGRRGGSVRSCESDWGVHAAPGRLLTPALGTSVLSTPGQGSLSFMDFPAVPNHAVGYGYQQKQQGVARQGQQVSGSVGSGARNLTLGQDTAARKIQGTGEKAPNDIHPQEPGDHPAQQAEVGHPHVLQNQQGEQGEEAAVDGQEGKVDEKKQDDGEKSEAVKSPSADQNTGSDEINETPETPETQNNNDTSIDDAHNGNNQNHGDHERLDANVYDSTPIQGTNETTAATNGDLADAVQEDGGSSGSAEMLPKIPGAWPTV